jgi:hypothetical protein
MEVEITHVKTDIILIFLKKTVEIFGIVEQKMGSVGDLFNFILFSSESFSS